MYPDPPAPVKGRCSRRHLSDGEFFSSTDRNFRVRRPAGAEYTRCGFHAPDDPTMFVVVRRQDGARRLYFDFHGLAAAHAEGQAESYLERMFAEACAATAPDDADPDAWVTPERIDVTIGQYFNLVEGDDLVDMTPREAARVVAEAAMASTAELVDILARDAWRTAGRCPDNVFVSEIVYHAKRLTTVWFQRVVDTLRADDVDLGNFMAGVGHDRLGAPA